MSYLGNLFVSLDQLANVLAGGNSDNTISARIGYYNHIEKNEKVNVIENEKATWYWKKYKQIIDWTFEPIDGVGHCHEAFHNDAGEEFDKKIKNWKVAFIALLIVPICIVIGSFLHLFLLLRIVSPKKIDRTKNIKKRLISVRSKLKGTLRKLNEKDISVDKISKDLTNEAQTILEEIEKKINKVNYKSR